MSFGMKDNLYNFKFQGKVSKEQKSAQRLEKAHNSSALQFETVQFESGESDSDERSSSQDNDFVHCMSGLLVVVQETVHVIFSCSPASDRCNSSWRRSRRTSQTVRPWEYLVATNSISINQLSA